MTQSDLAFRLRELELGDAQLVFGALVLRAVHQSFAMQEFGALQCPLRRFQLHFGERHLLLRTRVELRAGDLLPLVIASQ